jgi:hypothetical protein
VASQIRLLLDARSGTAGAGDEESLVARVSVRFRTRGSPASAALKNSPQPAKVELFSRFVDSGRQTQAGAGTSIGSVQGQISLQNGRAVFVCDPAALAKMSDDFVKAVDDSRQQQPRPTRSLGLQLESPDFTGLDPLADPPRLLLPANPNNRSHLEVLAELTVAGQLEGPRESNDILDVPLRPAFNFPLPGQKKDALADIGPPAGPILLASNDPSFVPGPGSIRDKVKAQNQKRNQDTSPETNPGGDFIPFHIVSAAARPQFSLDHGFLDDGKGGIDESKRRSPTAHDFASKAKWVLVLSGAQLLRDDLKDATDAYEHFLDADGTDFVFSYERFAKQDRTGAHIIESAIDDARSAAIELNDPRGGNHYVIQSDAIPVGAVDEDGNLLNPRYGYPGTENWQKAIGAHIVWIEADVTTGVDHKVGGQTFVIKMTLHAEDRYNFNPGNKDIATGVADAENGQFELTGLGREFTSLATLKRTVSFTLPTGPTQLRAVPPGQIVSAPNRQ